MMKRERKTACPDKADSWKRIARVINSNFGRNDVIITVKRTGKLSEIAEKWGMSVEELISYWEKKEPEYGAKMRRLVREHEDQESGSGGEKSKKKLRKKRECRAGRSGEERKNYLISFIFGVGLGYLVLFFFRLLQLIQ